MVSEGDSSDGDTSEGEEDDLNGGRVAIGGVYGVRASGDRGTATSSLEWGDISAGEGFDLTDLEFEIKETRVSSPKFGEYSPADGVSWKGRDGKHEKGVIPNSFDKGYHTGEGGSGSDVGVKERGSHGRWVSESGISYQQSQSKRTAIEAGVSIDHHQSGGIDGGSQQVCFTVFVGNIPITFSSWRLKSIFMAFGDVIDVFIPQKSSKIYNARFAFVRFKIREEADRAIQEMDGVEIEGQPLVVNMARFSRADSSGLHKPLKVPGSINCSEQQKPWSRVSVGMSYAQAVQKFEVHTRESPEVRRKISISSGNMDWLSASIVGTLRVGHEFGKVRNILIGSSEEVKEVSFLGGCRCLMSFSSVLNRNNALKDPVWSKWFFSMEPWKAESGGGTQRIWITCVGVPVTAWNAEFFALIGKQWGRLIDVDEETSNRSQFVQACLLIETKFCDIDENIDLDVDGFSYIVQVSSYFQKGLEGDQCGSASVEGGCGSEENGKHQQVDQFKAKDRSEVDRKMYCGSQEKLGSPRAIVSSSIADSSCSDFHFSARNYKSLLEDTIPVIFGFVEENTIRILDEDAGCLTRINGTEVKCRPVLDESEMRGGRSEEVYHNRKVMREPLQGCCKFPLKESVRGSLDTAADGLAGFGNHWSSGDKFDGISYEKEDGFESGSKAVQELAPEVCHCLSHKVPEVQSILNPSGNDISGSSGAVFGSDLPGNLGSSSVGIKSDLNTSGEEWINAQPTIMNGVSGIEVNKVVKVCSDYVADDQDQEGVKDDVACGGPDKITLASVQKFVASQDFINSSINLTTDVLVECKEHGIRISESDQRAIIEAMTKRHIQAEVDFYAESSSGGVIGAV